MKTKRKQTRKFTIRFRIFPHPVRLKTVSVSWIIIWVKKGKQTNKNKTKESQSVNTFFSVLTFPFYFDDHIVSYPPLCSENHSQLQNKNKHNKQNLCLRFQLIIVSVPNSFVVALARLLLLSSLRKKSRIEVRRSPTVQWITHKQKHKLLWNKRNDLE